MIFFFYFIAKIKFNHLFKQPVSSLLTTKETVFLNFILFYFILFYFILFYFILRRTRAKK